MDNKHIIKEFRSYVDGFVECCTSDHETHELLKAVDKLIEEQEERIAIMSESDKWIKTCDKTPKVNEWCWLLTICGDVVEGFLIKDWNKEYAWCISRPSHVSEFDYVTQWQYKVIPKPPKEGE